MKKLLYITNIPAPYRQKRFNIMAQVFPKYGIDFEVLYMAKIEPNRKWEILNDSYNYKHTFFKGIHPTIKGFFAHFNPSLLFRLMKDDYDIAIVGGMSSPTHWLAPFFISKDKVQVMSVESNLHSVERKTGIGFKIKKKLLSKANAYQITGNPQKKYIEYFYPESVSKKFIRLPNIIDEEVFKEEVENLKHDRLNLRKNFNVSEKVQMWVLPARLISIKGILPFLDLIKEIEGIKLFILGEGELAEEILDFIKLHKLPVHLVGFVQQNDVIKYYAAADLFVLPSLKDPSPLSPIEAIASGLPILVSSRIGNLEDVLDENENGWCYDPKGELSYAKSLIKKIVALTNEELQTKGKKSSLVYKKVFDSEACINSYAKELQKVL